MTERECAAFYEAPGRVFVPCPESLATGRSSFKNLRNLMGWDRICLTRYAYGEAEY